MKLRSCRYSPVLRMRSNFVLCLRSSGVFLSFGTDSWHWFATSPFVVQSSMMLDSRWVNAKVRVVDMNMTKPQPKPSQSPSFIQQSLPRPSARPWQDSDWQDSDWSWGWSGNWWNSNETWSQDKSYNEKDIEREESDTDPQQNAGFSEWEPSEHEPAEDFEWYVSAHEKTIRNSKEILQRHGCKRGGNSLPALPAPIHRSGKRGRSPPPKKKMRRRGKAKARFAEDKRNISKSDVRGLRYSQSSIKEYFQCGRKISHLVDDLLQNKVSSSAPFLRLSVFETSHPKTGEPILKCIDNRRLWALKEYAAKSGKEVKVNINFFSEETFMEVQRCMQNSDNIEGFDDVRIREKQNRIGTSKRCPF